MTWEPRLGAWPEDGGVRFRVWAPRARSLELILEDPATAPLPMESEEPEYFTVWVESLNPGTRYRYRIDGGPAYPDPASRFQPEGVHGPSEVIDPSRFDWTDAAWTGLPLNQVVLYELHVGTFSPEGTFEGVRQRLNWFTDLGVRAVELMPVAEFPGHRNWGYDGVDLFAPARCYGRPEDLLRLVDAAHARNLAVFLDVVYNHLGPEGAYLSQFSPYYFSPKHKSPWGDAVNLDDHHCGPVREFFIENALHWIHEYHIDGLRLDATHALIDDSPTHFLKELAHQVRASLPPGRTVLLIAEDDRNQSRLVQPVKSGGYELDAVWADDFHHQVRSLLAGDNEGYYQDFSGNIHDLAKTLRQGWFYTGQRSAFRNAPRGTLPVGIPIERFVHCIQNHDQIGNRARGDRLTDPVNLASYRAVSALLLLSPATPLLFMGQEWAATTPFIYFTDHPAELGQRVTEGRRQEFRHFKAFADPLARKRIPDPQAGDTFLKCKLNWKECDGDPHRGILKLYQDLLALRARDPALKRVEGSRFEVDVVGRFTLALRRQSPDHPPLLLVACLKEGDHVVLGKSSATQPGTDQKWTVEWTSQNPGYTTSPSSPKLLWGQKHQEIHFDRPCAVLLRAVPLEKA